MRKDGQLFRERTTWNAFEVAAVIGKTVNDPSNERKGRGLHKRR